MELDVYNPQKGRLETLFDVELTEENTTWFGNAKTSKDVWWIADYKRGILIKKMDYSYAIWIYDRYRDISRSDIDYNSKKAMELMRQHGL